MKTEEKLYSVATALKASTKKGWKNQDITWEQFVQFQEDVHIIGHTTTQFNKLDKKAQSQAKETYSYVAGYLKEGRRLIGHIGHRSMLVLESDSASASLWEDYILEIDKTALLHSTATHSPQKPKYRLIIPLSRNVSEEEYTPLVRIVCHTIGMEQFDWTCEQPTRLMYKASKLKDGQFVLKKHENELLNPDEWLAKMSNWQDATCWPEWPHESEVQIKDRLTKLGDPKDKQGIIGAWCSAYDIHEAIAEHLSDIYEKGSRSDRYSLIGGSTANGLVVYDGGAHAFSNHSTDTAAEGQHCINSYDLVRLHKFKGDDKQMQEYASADKRVRQIKYQQAMGDFAEEGQSIKETPKWLTLTKKGDAKIDHVLLAKEIAAEHNFMIGENFTLYYDTDKGVWRMHIEQRIRKILQAKLGRFWDEQYVRKALIYIKDDYDKDAKMPEGNKEWLVLNGGRYHIPTGKFVEGYDKELLAITQFPIKYDKDAKCPNFEGYMKAVYGVEQLPALFEWFGFQFYGKYNPQVWAFIVGMARSGKTTTIEIIQHLLGKDAYSNTPIPVLLKNDFARGSLYGKVANFDTELSDTFIKEPGRMKGLTDSEIWADVKNGKDFTFTNMAKQTVAMNYRPRFNDGTGFWRRTLVFETLGELPTQIFGIYPIEKILEEAPGIFNKAMEGLRRVIENVDKADQEKFSVTEKMREAITDLMLANNTVMQFLADTQDSLKWPIGRKDLYEKYRAHEAFDYEQTKPHGPRGFAEALRDLGYEETWMWVEEAKRTGRAWKKGKNTKEIKQPQRGENEYDPLLD